MNIMILVGWFWWKTHMFGTIFLAILWAMLGNYLGYWIGKWYGIEIIEKYGDYFGLGRTETKILHKQLEKNGFWYIVLGKFHNFTRAFIPFIAGSSGMSKKNSGSTIWLARLSGQFLSIFSEYSSSETMKLFSIILVRLVLELSLLYLAIFTFLSEKVWRIICEKKELEIIEKSQRKTQVR